MYNEKRKRKGRFTMNEQDKEFFERMEKEHGMLANDIQKEAILHKKGQLLLLAVPGSGKTTTMLLNIKKLIEDGYNPSRILAITFSKMSASDMKSRFNQLSPNEKSPYFSTIHSLAFRIVRRTFKKRNIRFKVLAEYESKQMIEQIAKDLNVKLKNNENDEGIEEVITGITLISNAMLSEEQVRQLKLNNLNAHQLQDIYNEYQKRKEIGVDGTRLIDFDDMLTISLDVLKNDKETWTSVATHFDYILTDESQDTSVVQHKIVDELVREHKNLFVVGDDDQSIYGWRGADVQMLLQFKKRYPNAKQLFMEQNYRSDKDIVSLSNDFIQKNIERYPKNMFTEREARGSVLFKKNKSLMQHYNQIINDIKDRDKEEWGETAILSRTNGYELPIVFLLDKNGIPFYQKKVERGMYFNFILQDIERILKLAEEMTLEEGLEDFLKIKANFFYLKKNEKSLLRKLAKEQPDMKLFQAIISLESSDWQQGSRITKVYEIIDTLKKPNFQMQLEHIFEKLQYKDSVIDMIEYFKQNPEREINIMESYAMMSEGIKDFDEFKNKLNTLYEKALHSQENNGVTIMTMHSSKGLEYNNVHLILPKAMNNESEKDMAILEEEARLIYVGMTRAKHNLKMYVDTSEEFSLSALRLMELIDIKYPHCMGTRESFYNRMVNQKITIEEKEKKETPKKKKQNKTKFEGKAQDLSTLKKGDTLLHKTFGEGVILQKNNDMLEIQFGEKTKKLSITFLQENNYIK